MGDFASAILLAAGALLLIVCSLGVLLMDDVFDRLHFVGPSILGVWAVVLAIVVEARFSSSGIKALLVAVLLTVAGPVLTHATARAARVRQYGQWVARPGERQRNG